MARRSSSSSRRPRPTTTPGRRAEEGKLQVQTFDIGPMPLIDHFL